jgi:L-alanine-DL-glutamate epimerase-like enolase superfamily enzyme
MKIASLRIHPAVVERRYGTVIARAGGEAKRTVTKSYFYFLEVKSDDGLVGWGEISDVEPAELPGDPGEYGETLLAFLKGRDPFGVQQMHRDFGEHFDRGKGSLARLTECALDMAMYDLQGRASERPVYDLLGGAVRKDVVISWVAFIREDLGDLREEVRRKVAEGFRAFKLKVGVDIDLDEKRLAIVREVAGKEASIKVDANEGWSVREAPRNIRRLHKYNLAGVETPVPRKDPADIAAVRRQVKVPILEHVSNLEYGLALIRARAIDVMNLATTGAGGLWPARQIVALAEAGDVGILLGSTVEMGPGTLAQLHLAATIPGLTLPSDLVGPGMYRDDVLAKPLTYHKGKLLIPAGPGLGGAIDSEKLRKLKF